MHDLYEKNYKILINKIKETNKWRDSPWSWTERFNNVSSFQLDLWKQNTNKLLCIYQQTILKSMWRTKAPTIASSGLKEKSWENWPAQLTKHYCDKDRTVPAKEEINRLKEESREPRNRSHTYTQQIISKGTNAIEWIINALLNK